MTVSRETLRAWKLEAEKIVAEPGWAWAPERAQARRVVHLVDALAEAEQRRADDLNAQAVIEKRGEEIDRQMRRAEAAEAVVERQLAGIEDALAYLQDPDGANPVDSINFAVKMLRGAVSGGESAEP